MKFRAYPFVAVLLVATLAPYTIAQNPPETQNPNPTAAPAVTGTPQTADSKETTTDKQVRNDAPVPLEIGRASCRERV